MKSIKVTKIKHLFISNNCTESEAILRLKSFKESHEVISTTYEPMANRYDIIYKEIQYIPIVHLMRGGAPDKIMLESSNSYELIKHDFTNLVDYDLTEIESIILNNDYILPADEGDIKCANKFKNIIEGFDQSRILLPHINICEGYCEVIDYNKFVPKDSEVYVNLTNNTDVNYATFMSMSVSEFKERYPLDILNSPSKIAIKSTTGSGSRGVWLIDPDRVHLGGKYVSKLTQSQLNEFILFCEKENCKVMIQDLIPNDTRLTKVNVDFVIKEGKLLGYKWDKTDPSAVFTNWNFGWFIRNEYTDKLMNEVADYLINKCGIWNAIMNFEAFSDMESETWLVEFNWRYSNSMFESQALGIDLIGSYLLGEPFNVPFGEHKFSRHWQCKLYNNIDNYKEGK